MYFLTRYVHTICPSQNLHLQSPCHGVIPASTPHLPGRIRSHKNHTRSDPSSSVYLVPAWPSFRPGSFCSQPRMMPLSNSMQTSWY